MSFQLTQANLDDFYSKTINVQYNGEYVETPTLFPDGAVVKFITKSGQWTSAAFVKPGSASVPMVRSDVPGYRRTMTGTVPAGPDWTMTYAGSGWGVGTDVCWILTSGDIDTITGNNMTLYVDGVEVTGAINVKRYQTAVFKPKKNFKIVSVGTDYDFVSFESINFTVSPDGKEATHTFNDNPNWPGGVTFSGVGNIEVVADIPVFVKGSNSVYLVDDSNMEKITSSRFTVPIGGGEVFDYGQFILGMIRLPFSIDPDLIVGERIIKLGPAITSASGKLMTVDRLVVPMGTVNVPNTYGNALDLMQTTTLLHLPFVDPVAVDVDYVIGQTLTIELSISLYDGAAVYNITSSKLPGAPFESVSVQLDVSIPFANVVGSIPYRNNPSNTKVGVDNGIKTPFVEVLRNEASEVGSMFTIPVTDQGVIGSYKGYAEVLNIDLKVKATSTELERLNQVLSQGIVIQ